jgi:L-ectoine synthase
LIVTQKDDLEGTERDVHAKTWRSVRFVLAREGVGFSFHETTIYAGTETSMWYANHIEAVYCVGGEGELVNDENGEVHPIRDGTMYLLNEHDRHTVRAKTDLRLICTFNPPVTGREVHDERGIYPLLTESTSSDDGEPTDPTTETQEVRA